MNTTEISLSEQISPQNLPAWEQARTSILPFLAPVESPRDFAPALRSHDTLAAMLTDKIKMYIAFFYKGIVIPLTEYLIRQWNVSWSSVRLAMDENMAALMHAVSLKPHVSPSGFSYYSVSHPLPICNSSLPFYKPFQRELHERFGETFYMAVPEKTTSVIFPANELTAYEAKLRNDVILTHDCSARPLSTELLEVSEAGVVALCD
ncbi:hypothetical protein [Treponema brennaborense]|uniref:Uncharacterized protein n=1 Tax=Treponema brennaborense (strain DSM 12168 / CIP 105900 / DD5/3) TaxID=906968 RepID=F4LJ78_TREBD|nr:hypothetical protein [Treponema brennaborense]AEE16335.1 hypothetical protein Trebr_0899 [Treponema brennaborense DSM 12168]